MSLCFVFTAQSYCKPRERKRKQAVICINRSHSAEPSELASALVYSRFSPPIDVPPSLRFVSVPCTSVFTAKLGGRTAKAARLCTFPHGSAGLCTFLSFSVPSVPQKDRIAVAPSIPCLLPSIPFPGYLFHLSGYSITLSKQTGYILNFQSSIFQPMSGTS